MKNPILTGLATLVLASSAGEAEGSTMIFGNPGVPNNGVEFNASTGYISIPFEVTNNDLNTEYSGAVVNSTKGSATEPTSGFQGLYDFGDNSTVYSSIEDMLTSQTGGKVNARLSLDANQGYVNSGWKIGFNAEGSISINRTSPIFSEDWLDDTNPDNNTAKGNLEIGSWLYDGDGNTGNFTLDRGSAAWGDAIPEIDSANFIPNAAVAQAGSVSLEAEGNYLGMEIIPGTPISNLCLNVELHQLEWPANSNETYSIFTTTSLTNHWQLLTNNLTGTHETETLDIDLSDGARFYKGLKSN